MTRTKWITTGLMVALIAGVSSLVYAQQAEPGGGDRNRAENRREARDGQGRADGAAGGDRNRAENRREARDGQGRPGGGDMRAEFRKRMNDRLKDSLAATEDEWKVIQPRLEKVQNLTMQSRFSGMMGMMGGRGARDGAGAPDNPAMQSEVAKAAHDLRIALEDKGTGNETIKVKVEALRKARAKATEELAKAQKDLREILTSRQEAQLIIAGLLD